VKFTRIYVWPIFAIAEAGERPGTENFRSLLYFSLLPGNNSQLVVICVVLLLFVFYVICVVLCIVCV